jgi:membrane protein DedA with SNARE-associated domain
LITINKSFGFLHAGILVSIVSAILLITFSIATGPINYSQTNQQSDDSKFSESCISLSVYTGEYFAGDYNEFSFVSDIVNITTTWIADYGYAGVFSAALLENLFPPIPSELIFPLAGFTANSKNLGLVEGALGMATMGAAGSTMGAIIVYYISMRIGRPAVLRYGRYVGIGKKEIEKTEDWFERHGQAAVFFGRMAPGIREIVSIPAGIQKMRLSVFIPLTFAGSLVWCIFLTLVGFYAGEAWNRFHDKYSFIFDIMAVVIVIGIILGIVFRHYKIKHKKDSKGN